MARSNGVATERRIAFGESHGAMKKSVRTYSFCPFLKSKMGSERTKQNTPRDEDAVYKCRSCIDTGKILCLVMSCICLRL